MDESDKNGKIMGGVNWAQISPEPKSYPATATTSI